MNNVLEYLENTTKKYPQSIAVDDGDIYLTWEDVVSLAQKIGTSFCERVEPENPIVLLMRKSSLTLTAMLGAVYAGCFYVIVDPSQPAARIREIFKVLEPKLVVVDSESEAIAERALDGEKKCTISELMKSRIRYNKLHTIRKNSKGSDLLYGIFTSGSTGTPKGVVVSHQAVIQFITHFTDTFELTHQDCIGNQAPFDFDVSVKDIYSSLMSGAKLVLIRKELFSLPARLLDYICEKEVTVLIWAVSALTMVSSLKGLNYRKPEQVRIILFSGEVMPVKQLRRWQLALPETRFVNLYGPSEITCNCTYHWIEKVYGDEEQIPIGKAFPGREVFLVDEKNREIMVPGTRGEIYITGESLSTGYYRNQIETSNHFLSCPKKQNQRCYRTGDLGYYGEEGELYFAGRKDFQIKHMGHRIELEEIQQKMESIPEVERCCCLMDEKRNQIVAFYLGTCTIEALKSQLKEFLPDYMIPKKLIKTTMIPLNKNGKTDRNYFKQQMEAR